MKVLQKYLDEGNQINISIINYYEIISGLKYKDARKQLKVFLEFIEYINVLPLTIESVTISAEIYRDLRIKGITIGDIDILIAGVALANNLSVITNNVKHFSKIKDLTVENWLNL